MTVVSKVEVAEDVPEDSEGVEKAGELSSDVDFSPFEIEVDEAEIGDGDDVGIVFDT